jgi:E3 ubiquitin-protein ligase HERC2
MDIFLLMYSSREEPTLVSGLSGKNIVAISCGSSHSAAISAEGDLYTWGRGNYGRLGHGKLLQYICCMYTDGTYNHNALLFQSIL